MAAYRAVLVTVKETSTTGWICLPGQEEPVALADPFIRVQMRQAYLDRGEELERVFYGLSNRTSPDFWLVVSPPGLGKSWFLRQLAARAESAATDWVTSLIDLRVDAGRDRSAITIICSLFSLAEPQSSGREDDVLVVAQSIIRAGRSHLCLLDSAELLAWTTVTQLRDYLGKIYRLIQDARSTGARLAFVVASRRDDGWRGITPYPRLSVLSLGGVRLSAIQNSLDGLAHHMRVVHSPAELRENAELVQRVTDGVPALVQQSLQWMQEEEWLAIGRLDNPQFFNKIIAPYIRNHLLVPDSLLPREEGQPEKTAPRLLVLLGALRALVPYRFFTLYHIRHHLDDDSSFKDALNEANWSIDDLWQAISDMALLYRPLDEAWQEIHPAIRRLLYRYFYEPEERAEAHLRARNFTKAWADRLTGKEQVIVMVESIWHEAARLRLSSGATFREDLIGLTRMQSLAVRSSFNSMIELRNYAAQRMRNDDELQREVAHDGGLFDKLVQVVLTPEAQGNLT